MSTVNAVNTFRHVSYLWDEKEAAALMNDELKLLIYRSNLLGSDLRLTNFGGGNTSCKVLEKNPLTLMQEEVMWIKGSGGDLGTLSKSGLSALYMSKLNSLRNIYRGIAFEDEMVENFNHCLYHLSSKAPSIDTALHAFLPFKHIDHLHPDAAIAIAAAKDGKQITADLFGGLIGWVDWQRPGFDLGLKLEKCLAENPKIRGIMLGSHGLFTWGDTSYESYVNTLEVIEQCALYLEEKIRIKSKIFGGQKHASLSKEARLKKASELAPVFRGLCSGSDLKSGDLQLVYKIGHFTDDERVLQFINSYDVERLGAMGTSCPDHFLRTKIKPLVLDISPDEDLTNVNTLMEKLKPSFGAYREMYTRYYKSCRHADSPPIRDSNPVVILCPGIGMFTFAKDKQTARLAAEFYINAINVMKGAEAISSYTALPPQEAFNIEYWLLEEAKLKRQPPAKALSGKIALVTGSAGGIGKAIARKFAEEGACVVINDYDVENLKEAANYFHKEFSSDVFTIVALDVTKNESIRNAFKAASLAFGGVDIIVNCAGLSISKPLENHTEADFDVLYDVLVKGQFMVTQAAVAIMRLQNSGGDVINIVSKNALVSGPNNAAYGSAKAAQLHLSRLNAAELGENKIRVNAINPDAVIEDSKIWKSGWAEGRAKAYGVSVAELPAYYAKRTLLNEIILPADIANAAFVFVGGALRKSTGCLLTVDGGIPSAFVR